MASSPLSESIPRRIRRHSAKTPKEGLVMRPLKLLARNCVLYNNREPFDTFTTTKAFVQDLRFARKHGWNSTNIWEGGPGEGKSEGALKYARIWVAMTGGKLHVIWDIDEIPELNDGDWVHLDEWLVPEGPGKIQAINRLWNFFTTIRAKQICISVSTPKAPELPFMTFLATTLAQDFTNRKNMFEIRVPLPRYGLVYVGNVLIPLHDDKEFRARYEAESYARKTQVVTDKGKKIISVKKDPIEAANEVIKWSEENDFQISTKGQALAALDVVAREKKWDINYSSEDTIANLVIMQKKKFNRVPEEYSGQVVELREAVLEQLERQYQIPDIAIKMFRDYMNGSNQDDIAAKFDLTQAMISKYIGTTSLLRVNLGYAFEDVWSARLKAEGKHIIQGGKNSPDPDICIVEEQRVIEVHSTKCYFNRRRVVSIPRKELAESELRYFDEGVPLKIVFFDIVSNKLFIEEVKEQPRFTFKING